MALPVKYKEVVWLHYYEGLPDRRDRGDAGPAAVDRAGINCATPAQKLKLTFGR